MAGSVSVNKHKTSAARVPGRAVAPAPLAAAHCQHRAVSRVAFHRTAPLLRVGFHGFARWWPYGPDIAGTRKAPKTGRVEPTITLPSLSEESANDAAIHRILPVRYRLSRKPARIRGRAGISSRLARGICAATGVCGEQAIPRIRGCR